MQLKIYSDFETLLKGVQSNVRNNTSHTEKYQEHILSSFASVTKVYVLMINLVIRMFFTEGKYEFIRVIETILEEYDLCTHTHTHTHTKKIILITI